MTKSIALAVPLLLLAGCGVAPVQTRSAPEAEACAAAANIKAVEYAGTYYGVENFVPASALARDMHCADAFKARIAPKGFVTIYGSSRLGENDAVYALVRQFTADWTRRYGRALPVMSGAGPGLMEAANRGAADAGGMSIGYTTYYDRPDTASTDPAKPYGGNAAKALNSYVTHGLVFSSVVTREAAMIKHSAAMVIAPGGTGTEWETYQIIETIKSKQLLPVPVYLIGDKNTHWASLVARLNDMVKRRTIRADEVAFVKFVATPAELVNALKADLKLP